MKKYISIIISAAMLCGLCACGDKSSDSDSFSAPEAATEASTEAATEENEETETEAPTEENGPEESEAPVSDDTGEADNDAFHLDSDGAVVFDSPAAQQSDATLIAAAQQLFESACNTSWKFSVGCPYEIDTEQYVENSYGWQFWLITEAGISSIDDVKADYHRVFSSAYPDHIDETFIEQDGRVYCLSGARGSNIFYQGSEIISVDGRDGSEIFFTVRNYYDGSDWDNESYYEDKQFSAVEESDGALRAGVFILPY